METEKQKNTKLISQEYLNECIKERAKSLKTNLKKNTNSEFKRHSQYKYIRGNQNKINRVIESAFDELIIKSCEGFIVFLKSIVFFKFRTASFRIKCINFSF